MAFAPGQRITASDFNALINSLNEVYSTGTGDSGYGATALSTVDPFPFDPNADLIDDQLWADLRNAIKKMGDHQGSVPTLPTINEPGDDIEEGDPVQAFAQLQPAITQVTTNKLLSNGAGATTITSPVLTTGRSDPWATQIRHTFTVDFGSDNAARWFFNTGGEIMISMDAPNTAASHNWGGLYNSAGTFIFDHSQYYALSSTINNPVVLATYTTGGGAYSGFGNQWIISAKFIQGTSSNGARGSKIEITSLSDDVYTGNPMFPGSPDIVTGTFISTIEERRSSTFFPQPAPTYETTVGLGDFVTPPSVTEYAIDKSVIFDSPNNEYLSWTPSLAGDDRKSWTFSTWVKRGALGTRQGIFGTGGANPDILEFTASDTLRFFQNNAAESDYETTAIFVDTAAWYHIVLAVDTTLATASQRIKLYVNGIAITDFTTQDTPGINFQGTINTTIEHSIGNGDLTGVAGTDNYFDGYQAETIFVDGSTLEPTAFGEFDTIDDSWVPVDPTSTSFGTNGFWLDYEDKTSVAALGADISGQVNHFAPVNMAVDNQSLDSPSNVDNLVYSINLNTSDFDLSSVLNLVSAKDIVLNIRPNVIVSSTSTSNAALNVGVLPSGSTLSIINQGTIIGAGGEGGQGADALGSGSATTFPGNPGDDGGDAIETTIDLSIDNTNGEIHGGAGGGGGGQGYRTQAVNATNPIPADKNDPGTPGMPGTTSNNFGGGGGGGGAGVIGGPGGDGGVGAGHSPTPGTPTPGDKNGPNPPNPGVIGNPPHPGADGNPGTQVLGGTGGAGAGSAANPGGPGGNPGAAGTPGGTGGGSGGNAGKAVELNGNAAVFSGGDLPPNLLGDVS